MSRSKSVRRIYVGPPTNTTPGNLYQICFRSPGGLRTGWIGPFTKIAVYQGKLRIYGSQQFEEGECIAHCDRKGRWLLDMRPIRIGIECGWLHPDTAFTTRYEQLVRRLYRPPKTPKTEAS